MGLPTAPVLRPSDRRLLQQAWVVPNIEVAAQRWSALFGVGPFYVAEYTPDRFTDVLYRGQAGEMSMRTAIAYAGDIQIELIEPTMVGPNCYHDLVPTGSEGFHHICFWSTDLAADIRHYLNQGCVVATQARVLNGPAFAYIDARPVCGCMVELLEYRESIEVRFNEWRDAAKTWERDRDPLLIPR
jgi:hypothetical protein